MAVKRRSSNKNPPILSHEFVIQNHADIVSCFAMVFVAGLMFQASSPTASLFITLQHNVSLGEGGEGPPPTRPEPVLYTSGPKDVAAIFFYFLVVIVVHQIIQEYLLDKVNRRLHLSKIKHSKFNESGQLLSFYLVSLVWAGDILVRENLYSVRMLWEGYPHANMSFMFKFFYIVQIAYWLHVFPELYFQRVKREEAGGRVLHASLYLLFVGGAYVLRYTRLALVLLVLQYAAEAVFHSCRLLSYGDKPQAARPLYRLHEAAFVAARLATVSLAVLTFWFGLAQVPAAGPYNSLVFRMAALTAVCLLQGWQMWNFITFHLRRMREKAGSADRPSAGPAAVKTRKTQQEKAKARKQAKEASSSAAKDDDEADLPEVDQNTKKALRQRK